MDPNIAFSLQRGRIISSGRYLGSRRTQWKGGQEEKKVLPLSFYKRHQQRQWWWQRDGQRHQNRTRGQPRERLSGFVFALSPKTFVTFPQPPETSQPTQWSKTQDTTEDCIRQNMCRIKEEGKKDRIKTIHNWFLLMNPILETILLYDFLKTNIERYEQKQCAVKIDFFAPGWFPLL